VGEYDVQYFSPEAEVPFCGHATIAAAVALAERDGPGDLVFRVSSGPVAVQTRRDPSDATTASLTSVRPHIEETSAEVVSEALIALGWRSEELEPRCRLASRMRERAI
jgi:predicted PhzF superfamily epimerase YddE/YHI9